MGSYLQSESQPSRRLVLPSSHCSPVSSVPLPHAAAAMVLHCASQVAVLGGSHSSGAVTRPSPQRLGSQTPLLQAPAPFWHAVPLETLPPGVQVWVVLLQVPGLTQAEALLEQLRVASVARQVKRQLGSQPSSGVRLPSSHSSVPSLRPSPQVMASQLPL